jgi:hypothetical protein
VILKRVIVNKVSFFTTWRPMTTRQRNGKQGPINIYELKTELYNCYSTINTTLGRRLDMVVVEQWGSSMFYEMRAQRGVCVLCRRDLDQSIVLGMQEFN